MEICGKYPTSTNYVGDGICKDGHSMEEHSATQALSSASCSYCGSDNVHCRKVVLVKLVTFEALHNG